MLIKKKEMSKYSAKLVEKSELVFWKSTAFLQKKSGNKKKFTILMPPPNVTGELHLGHALNGIIQDVIARQKIFEKYEINWVAGVDHAGISTQVKLENFLQNEKRMSAVEARNSILSFFPKWKKKYENAIWNQWQKLGLMLDYQHRSFTLSPEAKKIVVKVFKLMVEKGLVYYGKRIVNWDVLLQTSVSDLEVEYRLVRSKMFFVKYKLVSVKEKNKFVHVATTRPETIFADCALVVNPLDKRYYSLVGKKVLNPLTGEKMRIISDSIVDIKFGTGVLKCTPAHSKDDWEIAGRHSLQPKWAIGKSGKMTHIAGNYEGKDRFECRKEVVNFLKRSGLLTKEAEYENRVGFSEKSGVVIEPYLSEEWFVDMKKLIISTSKEYKNIVFYPEANRVQEKINNWNKNVLDWCISRQICLGHLIPSSFNKSSNVLDTWFSSSLWPLIAFEWFSNREKFYSSYPVSLLVTADDIIHFWVNRMILMCFFAVKEVPFKKIVVHGLVVDKEGKKMSKLLGNGVDPNELIEKYGTDSLRYYLITGTKIGNNIFFDERGLEKSWKFINKFWNAYFYLYVFKKKTHSKHSFSTLSEKVNIWIACLFVDMWKEAHIYLKEFDLFSFYNCMEKFFWEKYCSIYLELHKNLKEFFRKEIDKWIFQQLLIFFHPLLPFVTEYIYQKTAGLEKIEKKEAHSILSLDYEIFIKKIQRWISQKENVKRDKEIVEKLIGISASCRYFRSKHNLNKRFFLNVYTDFSISNKLLMTEIILYLREIHQVNFVRKLKMAQSWLRLEWKGYDVQIDFSNQLIKEKVIEEKRKTMQTILSDIIFGEQHLGRRTFLERADFDEVWKREEKLISSLRKYQKERKVFYNI